MARQQIGVVQELFRYPVKSMQGERLSTIDIGMHGVIGDRAYALQEANGRIATAKKWANLLEFSACYDTPPTPAALAPLRITMPDGRTILAQDPESSVALSTVLGRPVLLVRVQHDQVCQAEIDPTTVLGDVPIEQVLPERTVATMPTSIALPAGTFFDSASMHVLASGTLAHLCTLIGAEVQLDPRRFRPNIVVATPPDSTGFVEDEWLEGSLIVGENVELVQLRPTLRCVMTTHRQANLERDLRILRAAAQHHHDRVGVWTAVSTAGTIRVGDPVVLVR